MLSLSIVSNSSPLCKKNIDILYFIKEELNNVEVKNSKEVLLYINFVHQYIKSILPIILSFNNFTVFHFYILINFNFILIFSSFINFHLLLFFFFDLLFYQLISIFFIVQSLSSFHTLLIIDFNTIFIWFSI